MVRESVVCVFIPIDVPVSRFEGSLIHVSVLSGRENSLFKNRTTCAKIPKKGFDLVN